jgi:hypothetical protein
MPLRKVNVKTYIIIDCSKNSISYMHENVGSVLHMYVGLIYSETRAKEITLWFLKFERYRYDLRTRRVYIQVTKTNLILVHELKFILEYFCQ